MMIMPLVFYGIALVGFLIARVMGEAATPYGARVAIFWGWLASAPLALLYGLLAGFNGTDHPGTVLIGIVWVVVLIWFWGSGLFEASREG